MQTTNSINKGGYRLIPLSKGKFAKVDSWNYEWLMQYNWYAMKSCRTYYAVRNLPRDGKKRPKVFMHNEIKPVSAGYERDHKDRDGLNNTEENLREATHQQNAMNSPGNENVTSVYKGVYKSKKAKKWVAQIEVDAKKIHLGLYEDEVLAAIVYDDRAFQLYGVYAYLNFPERFKGKVLQNKDYEKNNIDKRSVCIS